MAKVTKSKASKAGKAEATKTSNGGLRTTWQGFSASKLFKWFGANGYTKAQAVQFAAEVGLTSNASTCNCQFYSGRALAAGTEPTHTGKPAELDKAQVKIIESVVGKPEAE